MKVANRIFYMFLKSLAENGVEMFLGGWKSRGYGLCEVKAIKLEEYTPITLVRGGPPQTYQREKIAQFIDRVLEELEEAR
jgi:CRISPR/Cas system CSM-associated protein Csm3 (group 7 of RAMP superfamily)